MLATNRTLCVMSVKKSKAIDLAHLPANLEIDETDGRFIVARDERLKTLVVGGFMTLFPLILMGMGLATASSTVAIFGLILVFLSVLATLYSGVRETIILSDGYLTRIKVNYMAQLLIRLNLHPVADVIAAPDAQHWRLENVQDIQHGKEMVSAKNRPYYQNSENYYAVHAVVAGDGIQQLMGDFRNKEAARALAGLIAARLFQPQIDSSRLAQQTDSDISDDYRIDDYRIDEQQQRHSTR